MGTFIKCPECGQEIDVIDCIDEEEEKGKFIISCVNCNKLIYVNYIKSNDYILEVNKVNSYYEIIDCVEDLNGVSSYIVLSDKPIPKKAILDCISPGYIGISTFELICTMYNLKYEEYFYE